MKVMFMEAATPLQKAAVRYLPEKRAAAASVAHAIRKTSADGQKR